MASDPAPRDDAARRIRPAGWGSLSRLSLTTVPAGDDRRASAQQAAVTTATAMIASALCADVAAWLRTQGDDAAADRYATGVVAADVVRWHLPNDPDRDAEFAVGVALRHLAERLSVQERRDDEAGLLAHLANDGAGGVAEAARALLLAENALPDDPSAMLSAAVFERFAWAVAVQVRDPACDLAIIAAIRALTGQHWSVADVAVQLACVLDGPLDALLLAALEDRRTELFVALLAQAADAEFGQVAALLLDPADDRLWWLCRALGLPRSTIARIGVALADAEPARDLERFADVLDAVMACPPPAAAARIAALRHPAGYRAALDAAGAAP